jgi:dTDP-4-dehydrorhamnose 3,5-epimerase-like enzyme
MNMCESASSLKLVKLPLFFEDNGELVVIEGVVNVPFNIARVFLVRAPDGAVRGQHAHRECSQFLTCPSGTVEVICDDGEQTAEFVLDHPNMGLLVPRGIWSQQTYKGPHAALTVLCDRPYEAGDYIRHYQGFKEFRRDMHLNRAN